MKLFHNFLQDRFVLPNVNGISRKPTDGSLPVNMEDENFLVGGKPLHDLRVVDLKKECDRNKLPKSGTKKELIERLKAVRFRLHALKKFTPEFDYFEIGYPPLILPCTKRA